MRIAVAGLHTETNTFSPVGVDAATVAALAMRGEEIVTRLSTSEETVTGFLAGCAEAGAEVVPLVHVNAWARGALTAEAFERIAEEILDGLATRGPFDAVLLAQHGAAVADGHPDADGELADRVRAVVGPGVVLAIGLDLHANVSARLVDATDIVVGYRENPHRDPAQRGLECARLAVRAVRGEVRPVQRLVRLPMVVPILGGWTAGGAMHDVMSEAAQIAERHALLSHTVFHGFGYADVPHMGSSVLALSDGDAAAAEHAAQELAASLWQRREALRGKALAPSAAIAEADRRASSAGPVVLLDVGDNIGGGAPGDSTVLLAEALQRRVAGFVATVCDEDAVRTAIAAGVGADVELELGGTTAVSAGPRLALRARVARVTDGRFEDATVTHGGFRFYDGGPTVRVTTSHGQELIVTSRTVPTFSPRQLEEVGLDACRQRVIVTKGVVAPRAGYEPVAACFVLVDTPGVTAAELSQLAYTRRPSPLWPLEEDAVWTGASSSSAA